MRFKVIAFWIEKDATFSAFFCKEQQVKYFTNQVSAQSFLNLNIHAVLSRIQMIAYTPRLTLGYNARLNNILRWRSAFLSW